MIIPSFFSDDYFDEVFNTMRGKETVKPLMRTDVKEIGSDYLLEIELPGFEKDEIHAELEKGYLTISGVRTNKIDEDDKCGKYVRRERSIGNRKTERLKKAFSFFSPGFYAESTAFLFL